MESSPETSITQDFNPFVSTGDAYGMGATGLIYEPLLEFDLAAPPKYYPWLATSYAWSNGGKTITFAIRPGVKWNNGTAFTPADVAYTFNLMKNNASVNLAGLKISNVTTSGNNVVITFPTAQYTNLENIAGTAIVPAAIWSKAGQPGDVRGREPGRHRTLHAGQLHAAGLHAGQEPQLLAGVPGQGPEGLFPGLHLQHRRAQRAVLRADRLDRELHPRPAEELRRHQPLRAPLLGGTRRHQ